MELTGLSPPVMRWEDSNLPEAWDKFERHVKLMFTGPLKAKKEDEQISYLLLWVGEKGRDIHATWTLSDEEAKQIDTYYEKFRAHVQPTLNPIFARFKFNNEVQGGESIDAYVTRLRLTARDCNFAELDNMIRDRIVFGSSNSKIREKLINVGAELTLDKAIQIAQSFEYSQEQLRTMEKKQIDACRVKTKKGACAKKKSAPTKPKSQGGKATDPARKDKSCSKCGTIHIPRSCPAFGKTCFKCGNPNHFSKCFRSSKKIATDKVHSLDDSQDLSDQEYNIDTLLYQLYLSGTGTFSCQQLHMSRHQVGCMWGLNKPQTCLLLVLSVAVPALFVGHWNFQLSAVAHVSASGGIYVEAEQTTDQLVFCWSCLCGKSPSQLLTGRRLGSVGTVD